MDENRLILTGRMDSPVSYSHCVQDTVFVRFLLAVERLSGTVDRLPVMCNIRMVDDRLIQGRTLYGECQLRSYAFLSANGVERMIVHAFARTLETAGEDAAHQNQALLSGRIVRAPVYRRTPLGREIADLAVSSERAYGKSDTVCVIAWGRSAARCADLKIGDAVRVRGRFQSRDYAKRLPTGEALSRTAYELSAAEIEFI